MSDPRTPAQLSEATRDDLKRIVEQDFARCATCDSGRHPPTRCTENADYDSAMKVAEAAFRQAVAAERRRLRQQIEKLQSYEINEHDDMLQKSRGDGILLLREDLLKLLGPEA